MDEALSKGVLPDASHSTPTPRPSPARSGAASAGLLLAVAALWPMAVHAGPLYGTVRVGAAPLAGGRVLIACPSFAARRDGAEAATDNSGSYSLRVAANGRCEMRVQRGNQVGAPFEVFLANNPLRLDVAVNAALTRQP